MTAGLNLNKCYFPCDQHLCINWMAELSCILVLHLDGKSKKGPGPERLHCWSILASSPPEYETDISLYTCDLYQHHSHFIFYKKKPHKTNIFSCNYNFWFLFKNSNHRACIAERPLLLVLMLYQKKLFPSGYTERIFQRKSKDFKAYFHSAYSVSYSNSISPLRRNSRNIYHIPLTMHLL